MKILIGITLFLLTSQWCYANDIPDFDANYLVRLNGIQAGQLTRTLSSTEDGSRLFTSQSQAKGVFAFFRPDIIKETSLWSYFDNKVRPIKYTYQRSGGKKEKFLKLDFNWQDMELNIDDKVHPWSLSLSKHTLDKLVYQLNLMQDLSDGKTEFNYLIADGGKLKNYTIRILGKEVVDTPMGKINTIKLTRKRERKQDRETVLWCAPSLNYLPVMLEHTEKSGARFTAVIRKLSGINTQEAFIPAKPPKQTIGLP